MYRTRMRKIWVSRMSMPLRGVWAAASIAASIGTSAITAHAQGTADASTIKAGHDVAVTTCLTCHQFSSYHDDALPRLIESGIPSFEEIAKNPNVTAESLRASMNSAKWHDDTLPLPFRPMSQISDPERAEVAAFIASFR